MRWRLIPRSLDKTEGGKIIRYCINCGAKLKDGVKICPNCGAPLPEENEPEKPVTVIPEQPETENTSPAPVNKKPERLDAAEAAAITEPEETKPANAAQPDKKSKLPIIIGVVIAVIALAIIIFTMTSSGGGKAIDLNDYLGDSIKDAENSEIGESIKEIAEVETLEEETEEAIVEEAVVNASPVNNASIKSITATSSLAEFDMVHTPELMIDGDYSTAWSEGVDGYGTGESVTINLDDVYTITGVEIYSGYQKSQDLFDKNSKPRDILLSFSDGSKIICELDEFYGGQKVNLPGAVQADSVTLTIQSVYPGSTYDDTVITEIILFDDIGYTPVSVTTDTSAVTEAGVELVEPETAQAEAASDWRQAYINYLRNDIDQTMQRGYALVYVDSDDIPELFVKGEYTASGSRIATYYDGEVKEILLDQHGAGYVEGENLILDEGGRMDSFHNIIYSLEDGDYILIADGRFGAEDNSHLQFDSDGNVIYKYFWNDVECTKDEYFDILNNFLDGKTVEEPKELLSLDEIIATLMLS